MVDPIPLYGVPIYGGAGYSPLTAAMVTLDAIDAIDAAHWRMMLNGIPSGEAERARRLAALAPDAADAPSVVGGRPDA
jgi:hypothetical protein